MAKSDIEVVVRIKVDMRWTDALKLRLAGGDAFGKWLRDHFEVEDHRTISFGTVGTPSEITKQP